MSELPVLETVGLGKRFGRRWAVKDLNLLVRKGEVFGFLGPNGAGKSTTIRMALSLITPTSGEVKLFGMPLRRHRREVLARVGGLVERPDFYLYLSARRNLEILAALRGNSQRREIDEVLEIVGLLSRAEEKVKTFSHGMKQRLGIGQALLGFPDLVILDEPTSGLDPQGIKEVRDLMKRLASERSMTVFLSSHLLHEIEQTATSMAIISAGTLVVQGNVQGLLSQGESMVRVNAVPPDTAQNVLAGCRAVSGLRRNGDILEFSVAREKIAEVNRALVLAGVEVQALIPKRTLEEYFLSLTEGASEVETNARFRTPRVPWVSRLVRRKDLR